MPDGFSTILDALHSTVDRGYQSQQRQREFATQRAQQAFAANPDDPSAASALMALSPDSYTNYVNAQTAQLKARQVASDAEQAATVTATRRAYISTHPELFGGAPVSAADEAGDAPSSVTPSPVSVASRVQPGSAAHPTLAPQPSSNAASALADLSRSSVLSGFGRPASAAALSSLSPTTSPTNSGAISLLSPLRQGSPSAGAPTAMSIGSGGLAALNGLGQPIAAPAAPSTPAQAPISTSGDDGTGPIVVTARERGPRPPTMADLASLDPDEAMKLVDLQTHMNSLTEGQQKVLAAKTDTWMSLYPQLAATKDYNQRLAIIDANRDLLRSHNITDAEIDSFQPTDGALDAERNLALGYKGVLGQQNIDRTYAETVRSHRANEASAAEGHSIQIRGQNLADARARQQFAGVGASLDPGSLDYAAEVYRLTGQVPSVGFGAAGSRTRTAIVQRAAQMAAANGQTAADDVAAHARYAGTLYGERAVGTRTANIEMAANEAANVIPLARQASSDLARSGFMPFARVQQMVQNGNNDPRLRRFVTANNAVINTYARAISPTGVPHVADQEHARQMLSTAFDQPSYNAVLTQMEREIGVARRAPGQVRDAMDQAITARLAGPTIARNPKTGQRLQLQNGKWVPIQ